MSVNILSFKTVSCLGFASLMFALGALQAFDESEIEMRKKHAGCDDRASKKCRRCPTGPRGPAGPVGPAGTPAAFVNAYSSGITTQNSAQAIPIVPTLAPINITTDIINPPVNIAHAGNTYVVGVSGVYSISFTVTTSGPGIPGVDAIFVFLNVNNTVFLATEGTGTGDVGEFISATVSTPLTQGSVVSLSVSSALGLHTVTQATLSITKISQP